MQFGKEGSLDEKMNRGPYSPTVKKPDAAVTSEQSKYGSAAKKAAQTPDDADRRNTEDQVI